jgi:hypothetical protein
MKSIDLLTEDQQNCIDRLYDHDSTLLVAKMGSGKTVCCLSAISELLAAGELTRVLVVAPLRVCKTVWGVESSEWGHLTGLDVGVCCGSVKEREKVLAERHAITVINFENLRWLCDQRKKCFSTGRDTAADCDFDGLVVDELTRFRKPGGAEFKALRVMRSQFKWVVGMTGTPVAEDWTGLYGMMLVVDGGGALGRNKERFMRQYFYQVDYAGYKWNLQSDGAERLAGAVAGCVYDMPDYRDSLPKLTKKVFSTVPDTATVRVYEELAEKMVVETDGCEITAASAGVLTMKLQQVASGFLYDADGGARVFSNERINNLMRLIDRDLSETGSVVVCYWWQADLVRIKAELKRLGGLRWVVLADDDAAVDRWNRGEVDVLLLHPKSAGHGLNLAGGGCRMVFVSPLWSLDLYAQTVARLWRRGQARPVQVTVIICRDLIDPLVWERMQGKGEYERLFVEHIERHKKTR